MKPALHSDPEPDALVLERCRVDPDPFRLIFDRHVDAVHRYLCARVGADDAEDLTAETFAVAWRKRATFALTAANARPWLFGIAVRLAQDHERSRQRQRRAFARAAGRDAMDETADAVARVDAARLSPQLAQAIGALRREDRDVVLLFALGELGYDEIALALDIRPGTVRSRLHRARSKLAARLPDRSGP